MSDNTRLNSTQDWLRYRHKCDAKFPSFIHPHVLLDMADPYDEGSGEPEQFPLIIHDSHLTSDDCPEWRHKVEYRKRIVCPHCKQAQIVFQSEMEAKE